MALCASRSAPDARGLSLLNLDRDSERIARLSFAKDGRRFPLATARRGRPFYRRGHLQAPIGRGVAGCKASRPAAFRDLQPQRVVRQQGMNSVGRLD